MTMARTEIATVTDESRLALCMLSRLETEIATLRKHLARNADDHTRDMDRQGIAYQAARQAKVVVAMAEYVHRNAKRAVQIAEHERFDV